MNNVTEARIKRELVEVEEKLAHYRERYRESNSENFKALILQNARILQQKKFDLEKLL